jgi:DNA topoisomerase I
VPRLHRSDAARPGISRRRSGRGFVYLWPDGRRVDDPDVLARVKALVIPPAWTDVWVCLSRNGHLQAVGTDTAGRRQYRYHDEWTRLRDAGKHERMLELAERLPAARTRVEESLGLRGMPAERALAVSFRLLDHGFFRVGSESYTAAHGTFGLATLRREHVRVRRDALTFEYRAKGGIDRVQRIVDPLLVPPVRFLLRRDGGGAELLAWRDRAGWHDVRSTDVNEYVREVTAGDFSAKDFRTWNSTVLMAQALAVSDGAPDSPTARRRAVTRAVQEVAVYLGNTPAVARRSYVDPRVVDLYLDGVTVDASVLDRTVASPGLAIHGALEREVLRMLRDPRRGRAAA